MKPVSDRGLHWGLEDRAVGSLVRDYKHLTHSDGISFFYFYIGALHFCILRILEAFSLWKEKNKLKNCFVLHSTCVR